MVAGVGVGVIVVGGTAVDVGAMVVIGRAVVVVVLGGAAGFSDEQFDANSTGSMSSNHHRCLWQG